MKINYPEKQEDGGKRPTGACHITRKINMAIASNRAVLHHSIKQMGPQGHKARRRRHRPRTLELDTNPRMRQSSLTNCCGLPPMQIKWALNNVSTTGPWACPYRMLWVSKGEVAGRPTGAGNTVAKRWRQHDYYGRYEPRCQSRPGIIDGNKYGDE